jgi:hypothetical protein
MHLIIQQEITVVILVQHWVTKLEIRSDSMM